MVEQDFVERISLLQSENIVDIDLSGVNFTTASEASFFHDVLERLVAESGRSWFFLTCFTGCSISPDIAAQFSMRRFYSHGCYSLGAVRYGASDELERAMTILGSNFKAEKVSFTNREEALSKIDEIKAAEKSFATTQLASQFVR